MSTNILALDRAIQNTILWLNDIQETLGWGNRDSVYKVTKAVLQTIRDRLPIEELAHFTANLPMIMKGMMMDNFDIQEKRKIKNLQEFCESIQEYYDPQKRDIIDCELAAKGVIAVLFNRIGAGEMRKVSDNMPLKLKTMFKEPSLAAGAVQS